MRRWTPVWATALAVFVVLMVLRPLPPSVGQTVSHAVQSATVLTACVVVGVRARRASGSLRRARALLSASLLLAALGGVTALLVRLGSDGPVPVPSPADAVHFAFLPLCVAGLLSYPVSPDLPGSRAQMILDGVVAATALWFLTYTFVLAPAEVTSGLSGLTAATVLAYPAADVFVIAMGAGALHRVHPAARREVGLSALGAALYAVSDIGYTALYAKGLYTADSWVAALAELGLVLIVLAVTAREGPLPPVTAWLGALPQVAAGVAVVVALALVARRGGIGGMALSLLLALMVALLLRQLVGSRDQLDALRRLRESQVLFRSLVVSSSDLITMHRPDGGVLYASPAVSGLTGVSGERITRTPLADLLHPEDLPAVRALGRRLLRHGGATGEVLLRLRAGDGTWRWCQAVAHNRLDDPDVRAVVCNTRDVHDRHLLEERLQHEASHDALTGLGNLAHARGLLERACRADGRPTMAALVDLDGFKQVNDTFGHAEGDALLRVVAGRLRRAVRPTDDVARVGGDEFLLVLAHDDGAEGVAERVLQAVCEPLVVDGRDLSVGASIGLASLRPGGSPEELLRHADLAMYAAKSAGRNQIAWFEPAMDEAARSRMTVTTDLRRAIEEGRLELRYQPIVDLGSGDPVCVEALVRWRDRDGALVPRDAFILVAEEAGLMTDVDAWAVDRACADLARWRDEGSTVPGVSVDVSARSLTPDLVPVVTTALGRHRLDGTRLCLEITGTALAQDAATATEVLTELRALGVQVALDDFGTGPASLSALATLPIDLVKVDPSFLGEPHERAVAVLGSITSLCAALGLPVVAGGVDDLALVDELTRVGCAYGQGDALTALQRPVDGSDSGHTSTRVSGMDESTGRSRSDGSSPRRTAAAPSAAIIAPLSVQ